MIFFRSGNPRGNFLNEKASSMISAEIFKRSLKFPVYLLIQNCGERCFLFSTTRAENCWFPRPPIDGEYNKAQHGGFNGLFWIIKYKPLLLILNGVAEVVKVLHPKQNKQLRAFKSCKTFRALLIPWWFLHPSYLLLKKDKIFSIQLAFDSLMVSPTTGLQKMDEALDSLEHFSLKEKLKRL